MLVELTGHNDAPVFVNPKHVRAVEPGTTLGTTHILVLEKSDPLVVQGYLRTVAKALGFKRRGGRTAPDRE
jgi:hypothetical protein